MIQKKLRRLNDRLLCIFEDGTVSLESVLGVEGNSLETVNRVVTVSDLDKFVDVSGSVFYATNLNVASRVESENLKKLRRSSFVNNVFSYQNKKFDFFTLIPWVIVAIAIIFR